MRADRVRVDLLVGMEGMITILALRAPRGVPSIDAE